MRLSSRITVAFGQKRRWTEWNEGRPQRKLTGHRSAEEVDDIFGSSLVDVAYVVETVDDAVFIVAADPAWPVDTADLEWLCGITRDTLSSHGTTGIELSMVPARTAAEAEPGAAADGGGTTAFPGS